MKMRNAGFAAGLVVMLVACNPETANQPSPGPALEAAAAAAAPAAVEVPGNEALSTCNIERVDQQAFEPTLPQVKTGAIARISGWLVDHRTRSVPADVRLQLVAGDGSIAHEQAVVMWRDRPDVVTAQGGLSEYLRSGFSVDVSFENIAPGQYAMVLSGNDAAGPFSCDVERDVVVSP